MDRKIMLAIMTIFLLGCAGVVFSSPDQHKGMMGWEQNFTAKNHTRMNINSMRQTINSTEFRQFEQAVISEDYQTTKKLQRKISEDFARIRKSGRICESDDQYGLGGPIFDKLNETTFPDYSQIHILSEKLKSELGGDVERPIGNINERHDPGFERGMRGR